MRERSHRAPLLGLAFLVVIALLITASIAQYRKAFPWQKGVSVTLVTPAAGLQLTPPAEVKFDGLIVGSVRSVTTNGTDAVLHISLNPADRHYIPTNVDAEIIPKTLFGEKYVNLRLPAAPSPTVIEAGDEIRQSTTSLELSAIFNDVGPVLQTLQPQQLAATLSAISQALEGRGAELGQSISLLHHYLSGIDPHLSMLTSDLRLLATTANSYAAASPALLDLLDNSRAISSDLLVPKQQNFAAFLHETVTSASEATQVLSRNSRQLIKLAGSSRAVLSLLANYSSEIPCFVHALYIGNGGLDHTFGGPGPYLKVTIDQLTANKPFKNPGDLPSSKTSDANNARLPKGIPNGPYCVKIPDSAKGQSDAKPYSLEFQPGPTVDVPGFSSLLVAPTLGPARVVQP